MLSPLPTPLARSVVVCCYTDERWSLLSEAIASAAGQLGAADDIVVVVDYNPELHERVAAQFSDVAKVVANTQEQGLSGARNTGVTHANGNVVVFLDDDAAAEPGWLDALTSPFGDGDVVGVGGAAEPRWDGGDAPWWMPPEFYWVVGCSYVGLPTTASEIRNPIGCNMAFRRRAIQEVDGFSAALGRIGRKPVGGEETDLAIRIRNTCGGRILYAPDALVRHAVEAPRMKPGYFARRCFAEGQSKAILASRVGTMSATEAERTYLGTLLRGGGARLGQTVRHRSFRPLGQAAALVAGLVLTTLGFAWGFVQGKAQTMRVLA